MIRKYLTPAACLALAACAQSPETIEPTYTSTLAYDTYSCRQLGEESERLQAELSKASIKQQHARTDDAASLLLIGVPMATMTGSDATTEVARLKGEVNALRNASEAKNCGLDIPEAVYKPIPNPKTQETKGTLDP